MSKLLTLSLAAMMFVLTSCGSKETVSNNAGNANKGVVVANSNTNTAVAPNKSAETAPTTTVAAGDKIGIAECDEYLTKVESCITSKVPEASRAMFKPSLDQTRKSWKDLAANPQTKTGLASACKQALATAKQTYASFSCEF